MLIEVPEGHALWIWTCGGEATPVIAENGDEAYRKVIACRLETAESVEEAEAWFRKNDELVQVTCGPLTTAPFEGELPED